MMYPGIERLSRCRKRGNGKIAPQYQGSRGLSC